MRVLFVNTNDGSGGAARAALRIMRGVQRRGVDASMFVKTKLSNNTDIFPLDNFAPHSRVHMLIDWCLLKVKNKWQHHKWRPYKRTKSPLYLSDLRSTRIYGALQKQEYDILHLHWFNQRFVDIQELKKVGKPIVWTLHDSWAFTGVCHVQYDCERYQTHCANCPMLGSSRAKDLAHEVFEKKRKAYEGLNLHIVTPSRWLADCVRQSALLGRYPVTVIPNCLDTELFSPQDKTQARLSLGLELDKTYILFGAMNATQDPNKGYSELLKALELLDGRLDNSVLLVFGTDASVETTIPVLSMGVIRDDKKLAKLYCAADIMVVPSRSETFGQTASEAMSCGTPVVVFARTGIQEVVDHKQTGYVAVDEEDFARGIVWCLRCSNRELLGQMARQKVLDNYSTYKVSLQYLALYKEILL